VEENPAEPVRSSDDTLFYSSYMQIQDPLVASVRSEAFGEDIGQFGWTTADEMRRFFQLLELGPRSKVLDVACGSGGPSLFMARTTGCHVTGVDITYSGIETAAETAAALGLTALARFQQVDAGGPLPFEDNSFDAITCIDAMNHFLNRTPLFKEWFRVLQPGGRILFTNPVVVTGLLEREEIIARSGSMGVFVFTPPGLDERLVEAAGFASPLVEDVTPNIELVSRRWRQARENHAAGLAKLEGQATFDAFQRFLASVNKLSSEQRLSRMLYVARKAD
jgi:SAM-dependent methyltransferase